MSSFDLVTRMFGIVLALAISEVLKGFARLWRLHHRIEEVEGEPVHIGWLVPLLAALMLLDQVTFWFNFSQIGPHVPTNLFGLAGFMAVIGAYFALSTFVFPPDVKTWPDFDLYYFKVRRTVIGGLLAVNAIGMAYELALVLSGVDMDAGVEAGEPGLFAHVMMLATAAQLVALLLVTRKRTSLALLAGTIVTNLASDLPF